MARIGVALSGGGHRATLFGLGVLMYLADAEKSREVVTISSVSGGSITNGFVGQECDYRALDGPAFREVALRLARQIALSGTLWAIGATWVYLTTLAVVLAGSVAVWFVPAPVWARTIACLAIIGVLGAMARLRNRVCSRALRKTLFSRDSQPTRLDSIHQGVDHVMCATDLHAGEHVYFSGRFVYAYRFGCGRPAGLPLHVAVQASACFPILFPPRFLRTEPHAFPGGPAGGPRIPQHLVLTDGGVYDNMADQWPMNARTRRWLEAERRPDEVIVVNAGTALPWGGLGSLRLPVVGEFSGIARIINSLYENTHSPRRLSLVRDFDLAEKEGVGIRGALVMIEQTPFKVADYFMGERVAREWPERAKRARAFRTHLRGEDDGTWAATVDQNRTVKTTLSRLGVDVSAALLRHGYATAMGNLHVVLGYPLASLPSIEEFREMLR